MNEWTNETTDAVLLRGYSNTGAEDAFAELVRRRLPMVYSTVLRRLGNEPSAAEDITQSVFIELARQARQLATHPVLAGWLYTTASRMATDYSRRTHRRQLREQTLMNSDATPPASEMAWEKLKPVLDDALQALPEEDRQAVVLRYLDQRDFNAIGGELGLSPAAARMRVSRALEKLRSRLAARGLATAGVALETLLAQHATVAVPPGLVATIGAGVRQLPSVAMAAPAFSWASRKLVLAAAVALVGGGGVLAVKLQRQWARASYDSPASRVVHEANAKINQTFRPRWMARTANSAATAEKTSPLVSEALGFLRSALFDVQLDKAERFRLLEQSAGMLVGHESETISIFREAFSSPEHETVSTAIDAVGRFGKQLPKEFTGELMALLENPEFKDEAGLIANRLVFPMMESDSPVPSLLALLKRRPDLYERVEYLFQGAVGMRPGSLAEHHELVETLINESTGDVQAASKKLLERLPPLPKPPDPELALKLLSNLQSPIGTARWDALGEIHMLGGSTPEIRQALAEMMQNDPLPANRLEARRALQKKAPEDPALAALPDPMTLKPSAELQGRLSRNEVPVAEMLKSLVDRPADIPTICRAITQVPATYWQEHFDEQLQVGSVIASLHLDQDARVYEAAADAHSAFYNGPRQYYTVEELKPFFDAMEFALTPGEYAIAMRDNDFAAYWKSFGFRQLEPTHLRTQQVQNLLIGPSFQNPPAYKHLLKVMQEIDPKFQPPAR